MVCLIGRITETFDIEGRGVVAVTDTPYAQLPAELAVRVGDPIELRPDKGSTVRTRLAGIEHCDPWTPTQCFGFLLPPELGKADVPIGAEVWASAVDAR